MKFVSKDFEFTPLVAYGLLTITCVLGFLGLESFAKADADLERRVVAAQTEFATLSTIRETDYWDDRLVQSTSARAELQNQIWQGRTSGVIAAELQQALNLIATTLKFDQIQIRVDPNPVDVDGINVLTFEFTGLAPSSKVFADFFEAIATYEKILILDELDFSQSLRDRRPTRIGMIGRAPIQIILTENSVTP